jgi:hypothetical protein
MYLAFLQAVLATAAAALIKLLSCLATPCKGQNTATLHESYHQITVIVSSNQPHLP